MMAAKARLMGDARSLASILAAADPAAVKALGRAIAPWDEGKSGAARYGIVVRGKMLKFEQNEDVRRLLLSTGDRQLTKAASRDAVWGVGVTAAAARAGTAWRGQNSLGLALMDVRARLRRHPVEFPQRGTRCLGRRAGG